MFAFIHAHTWTWIKYRHYSKAYFATSTYMKSSVVRQKQQKMYNPRPIPLKRINPYIRIGKVYMRVLPLLAQLGKKKPRKIINFNEEIHAGEKKLL